MPRSEVNDSGYAQLHKGKHDRWLGIRHVDQGQGEERYI